MKRIFTLSLVLFGLFSLPVFAQINTDDFAGEQGPSIVLEPSFPQPGQEFTATLQDFTADSFGSNFTWYLDGEIIPEGVNNRKITLIAPKAGQSQTLTASLAKSSGRTTETNKVISPLYVDIIVEPQTHVPDFYLGRSLPSFGSTVNMTALVGDGRVTNQDFVYTWKVGREVIGGGPMRGRRSTSFTTPIDTNLIVSVSVSKPDGTEVAERYIFIPSVQPYLRFYESNALLGLKQKTVSEPYSIIGNSVTLRAEPYHLDSNVFNSPSIAEWSIGNSTYPEAGGNPYEVTLEKTGAPGNTSLKFHVRNTEQVLQGARDSIDIKL